MNIDATKLIAELDKKKKAPEDVHHLGNGAYQAKNHMGNE